MLPDDAFLRECKGTRGADGARLDEIDRRIDELRSERETLIERIRWAEKVHLSFAGVPVSRFERITANGRRKMELRRPNVFPYTGAHIYDHVRGDGVGLVCHGPDQISGGTFSLFDTWDEALDAAAAYLGGTARVSEPSR